MYNEMMDTIGLVNTVDPELAAAMDRELNRQRQNIELIASENIVSPAVMAAMGSILTNKYAEGLPGNLPELDVNGCRIVSTGVDDAELYADCVLRTEPCTLHAVPYGLWGNRVPGEMRVWVDTTIS